MQIDCSSRVGARNLPGFILLIDFEEAFDSVSSNMINCTLFSFGKYCHEWVVILLMDFRACVNNSGNIAFISRSDINPYSPTNLQSHLLDQYADDLTMYLERTKSHELNYANVNAVLDTLEQS